MLSIAKCSMLIIIINSTNQPYYISMRIDILIPKLILIDISKMIQVLLSEKI